MVAQYVFKQVCICEVDDPEDGSKALVSDGRPGWGAVHLIKDPKQSLYEALGQLGVLFHQLSACVLSPHLQVPSCEDRHCFTTFHTKYLSHNLVMSHIYESKVWLDAHLQLHFKCAYGLPLVIIILHQRSTEQKPVRTLHGVCCDATMLCTEVVNLKHGRERSLYASSMRYYIVI